MSEGNNETKKQDTEDRYKKFETTITAFENKLEDWRQMYEEAVEFGEIPKGMMDDLTDCCKSIESICRNIQNLQPDHVNRFPILASNKKNVKNVYEDQNVKDVQDEQKSSKPGCLKCQRCPGCPAV